MVIDLNTLRDHYKAGIVKDYSVWKAAAAMDSLMVHIG